MRAGFPRRVLVIADQVAATQWISFARPLADCDDLVLDMQSQGLPDPRIAARFAEAAPDLLVLSRMTGPEGAIWITQARAAGIPVLFHIDDDLLAVPLSLGREKYQAYNAPDRLRALRANMEASDLVYASTAALADALRGHGIKTPIVAGAVYCSVNPRRLAVPLTCAGGPVIGYMGTAGHAADLAEILPVVEELMLTLPELQFEIFGGLDIPPPLRRFENRVRSIAPVGDYRAFLEKLQSLGWWIGLAPLQDTGFNRCKADTKWVEYSLSGMAVVAADLPVYHRACADGAGMLAADHAAWRQAIKALLFDPDLRKRVTMQARHQLETVYTHAALRAQISDIFAQAIARAG